MKIKKSQLRKIILERLLVEAISVAQAEAKLKNSIPKMINSIEFIIKRDGGAEKIFEKYKNNYNMYDDPDPYDRLSLRLKEGIEEREKQAYAKNLFNYLIGDLISRDMTESGRSNSILFLIKKMNEDPPLAYFLLRVACSIAWDPYFAFPNFPDEIRNSLELHDQYKHIIIPKEKRDLFRIENLEELTALIAANKPAIDEENERLSRRVGVKNAAEGFKPLTGKLNLSKENNALVLNKNPQTGFYTIPDANGFVIGEIHTKAASVKLGSGTDWCTAAPGLDYFDDYYSPDDPLYYIEDNGERFQFHYGEEQFMDRDDNPIDEELVQKYTYMIEDLLIKRDGLIQNENLEKYLLEILGSDPNLTPEELDKLSKHEALSVRGNVAKNKNTSKETLTKLSNGNVYVNIRVASNPNTPPDVLDKLVKRFKRGESAAKVREKVAANKSTHRETLASLALDLFGPVRLAAAFNTSTPIESLIKLASDPFAKVNAVKNPVYIEYLKSQNPMQEKWLKIAGLLN